jgi:hypothetical protein
MLKAVAYKYTAGASEEVFKLWAYIGTSVGDGSGIEIGVYDVTGGIGSASKVASGTIATLSANAWNSVSITPVALTNGNTYAVAWRVISATNVSLYTKYIGANTFSASSLTGSSALNASWTDNASGSSQFSIYAETQTSGPTLTDVDTDETILAGQASVAYTGTGLTSADAMRINTGTKYASATSFSATNATSGTFTAPTASAIRTAGVKFGACTFDIRASGASLATLAGTINPSSGLTVHNVTDISQAADTGCLYYGQSPAIAVGDQILFDSTTAINGWMVTIDSQGFVTIDSGGSEAADNFNYYIWDATDETWGTVGSWSINGANFTINNIWQWIESAQGGSRARAETVMAYLVAQGYTNQGINSGLFNWLGGFGYTGGLNSRISSFERDNTDRYN